MARTRCPSVSMMMNAEIVYNDKFMAAIYTMSRKDSVLAGHKGGGGDGTVVASGTDSDGHWQALPQVDA